MSIHRFSHEEVPFLWGVTDLCSMTSERRQCRPMSLSEDIWVMDDRDDSPERGEWNPDPEEVKPRESSGNSNVVITYLGLSENRVYSQL